MAQGAWERMMGVKYLRHRCNTTEDVLRWLPLYAGAECDVRLNDDNEAVVEHHPGENGSPPLSLQGWLSVCSAVAGRPVTYAINTKSNGLVSRLQPLLVGRTDYFLFDVPGEEIEEYLAAGLRVFGRASEYDYQQGFSRSDLPGYVIDCFTGDYGVYHSLLSDIERTTPIAVIGEDLRNRPPLGDETLASLRAAYLITKELPR